MQENQGFTAIVHITCRLDDGRVIDSTHGREPLFLKIGAGETVIPELEQALAGMKPGESKSLRLSAARTRMLYNSEMVSLMRGQDMLCDVHLVNILSPLQTVALEKINTGIAYRNEGKIHEATACLREAVQLSPELPAAQYLLGTLLQQQGKIDDAIVCFQKILLISPEHAETHNILGSAFQEKGELDEAATSYRNAIQCDRDAFMAYNNLGVVLRLQNRLDESVEAYEQALRIKPDFAVAMNNLGTALRDKGCLGEAMSWYRKAIRLDPDFADAHWNLSFALLLGGNYEEGWQEYEWIWKLKKPGYTFPQPRWKGDDIRGKRILLYAEQGFGDVIQFARYASMVSVRGAEVIVGCQKELKQIFKSLSGVRSVVTFGEAMTQFDFQCPLPSLPRIFNTTLNSIPSKVPYLQVDDHTIKKWGDKLSLDNAKLHAGLAWAGSPGHLNDRNRSCPADLFLRLSRMDGLQLVNLQKEIPDRWMYSSLSEMNLIDCMMDVADFSDTAGIIMNLDLVISVDTAIAHLAGALGKPVWTLLPFAPDWRWMLEREDSPWYPTMRLFRQPKPGDWESVIERIRREVLENLPVKDH